MSDFGIDVPPNNASAFRTTWVDAGMNLAEYTLALSSAKQVTDAVTKQVVLSYICKLEMQA